MKIGIMSDSHENMDKIRAAVNLFNSENIGHLLHAGDIISPITYKEFKNLKCKMTAVFGNNDGERLFFLEKFKGIAEFYSGFRELEIEGRKIVLMHEPRNIDELLEFGHYDLIIYGHTHIIDVRKKKAQALNPGECGGWLTGRSTVAVFDLADMTVKIADI